MCTTGEDTARDTNTPREKLAVATVRESIMVVWREDQLEMNGNSKGADAEEGLQDL